MDMACQQETRNTECYPVYTGEKCMSKLQIAALSALTLLLVAIYLPFRGLKNALQDS